jgi:hypothetical protein
MPPARAAQSDAVASNSHKRKRVAVKPDPDGSGDADAADARSKDGAAATAANQLVAVSHLGGGSELAKQEPSCVDGIYRFDGEDDMDLIDVANLHAEKTAERLVREGWLQDDVRLGVHHTVVAVVYAHRDAKCRSVREAHLTAVLQGAVRAALNKRGISCNYNNNNNKGK